MSKNIVICSDGTGNTFDKRITNVTRLVQNLALDRQDQQVVVYDQGVGTTARRERLVSRVADRSQDTPALRMLPAPLTTSGTSSFVNRSRGLLFGHGIKDNVRQMYTALA